jgi:hypothetical protein
MFVNLYNSSDTITSLNGVTGSTGLQANTFGAGISNFIAQTTPVDPTNVVQCINVTKSAKPSGLGTYTTTKTPKTLKSYTIPYTSLTPGQLATFYMWYANNNPTKNVSSIQFTYKAAQNPTRVTGLTITPSATSQLITITFTGSSAIDSGDPLSTALVNYAISYNSIAGSNTRRYGGTKLSGVVNGETIGPTDATGGAQSQTNTTSIYPDTLYFVTVNASNTTLGLGSFTGTTGINIIQTTGPAGPAAQTSSSKLLSTNVLSAKSVFGGSTVLNLLKTKDNRELLPSLTTPFNIHNSYESRGYAGPNALVDFTTNLSGPVGIIGGPSASIYGFSGTYNYPNSTTPLNINGINLSFTSPVDTGSETNGTNGYYLKTDATVSITNASNIVASSNQYTMCVTGTYSSGNGAPASAATTFYYDGETGTNGTPSISSQPAISIASAVTGAVCGINVVTSISFNIGVTGVTGIGQYFYNAGDNGIISYAPTGSVPLQALSFTPPRETDLSKLTSGIGSNGFNTPISFSRNSISLSGIALSQYYAGPVGVSVTPYNIDNKNGNAVSSNTFPLIFDPVSVANLRTQILSVDNSQHISGCRVWSGTSVGNEAVGATTLATLTSNNNKSFSVADSVYNNTKDISNLSDTYKYELLFANNAYTTYDTYMINYATYLNGPNYSLLKGTTAGLIKGSIYYRYATFAWKVNTEKLGSAGFSNIQFILSSYSSSQYVSVTSGGSLQINSISPFLYYRVEDSTSLESIIDIGNLSNPVSTPWINGNLLDNDKKISNSSFNSLSTNYTGLASDTSINITGSDIIFNTLLPNPLKNTSGSSVYIYCRIGIPISVSFSFKDIKCKLI